jgi:hypothetical protein
MKSREAEQTLVAGPQKRGDGLRSARARGEGTNARRVEGAKVDFKRWAENLAGPKGREEKEKGFLFIFRKYFRERNNLEIAR